MLLRKIKHAVMPFICVLSALNAQPGKLYQSCADNALALTLDTVQEWMDGCGWYVAIYRTAFYNVKDSE